MTAKIPLSVLGGVSPEDFKMCVEVHAKNLRDHDAHMQKVAEGSAEHVGYPPPMTLPLVDSCVRRPDLVEDYEIVDDTPPPPTPEERTRLARAKRRGELADLELAAAQAVIPQGKVRSRALREQDIRTGKTVSKTDAAFLKEQEAIRQKLNAIHRHGADLEAALEDLDEEALKSWQPAPFPG